jgi:hypothetical protein
VLVQRHWEQAAERQAVKKPHFLPKIQHSLFNTFVLSYAKFWSSIICLKIQKG